MRTEKRLNYLKTQWKPYPEITEKVSTFGELKSEFSLLTAGKPSKADHIWLAGRVSTVVKSALADQTEQIAITSDGEEYFLKLQHLNEIPEARELVQNVIEKGDLVLVKVEWINVHTSGMFPKIENMLPTELKLLAPAFGEALVAETPFVRAKQWSHFQTLIRNCFQFLKFNEVSTPTLVESPGLEPFLDPFKTEFKMGSQTRTFYLPTSPEFHLKKMLAMGFTRIFEMKESFRNGELSPIHQPEFTMLEWYRAYANLDAIIADVRGLLNYLKLHWPTPIKGWGPLAVKTMAQVFKETLSFELTPQTSREQLLELAKQLEVDTHPTDSWNDLFHRIFSEKIEPKIGHQQPVIVRNFPPSQAAWARHTSDGWADRFELYWRGVELGNAFHELNDPKEQRQRFEDANRERVAMGRPEMPIDKDLMRAIEGGFPPSAGIAIGLDRLFMLLVDEREIAKTRFFTKSF